MASMKLLQGMLFAGFLAGAPLVGSALQVTSASTGTVTTVAYFADGSTVTTTAPMNVLQFYSQLRITLPASTAASTGDPPPMPPPPTGSQEPPYVGGVTYTSSYNGWTRSTTYGRTVTPYSGGYADGPWGLTSDHLDPSGGGGSNCPKSDLKCNGEAQ